ncbi:MAG TPA: hypothetical protein VK816_01845 [Jatrophihabitantaceae bacterium]|nr:hypothetical protein [Jatrophihabitantaceae bacterium]
MAGQVLIGKVGMVTTGVRGGALPGEVRVVVGGLPHYYLAFCADPVAAGAKVLVINDRGYRQVDVEPWDQPEQDVEGIPTGHP